MKIETHKVLQRGNIHSRRLAIELRLADAEGVFVPIEVIRQLPEVFSFMRKDVSDCPAWRRLTGAETSVPAAAVVEVMAVIAQRYLYWPVKFCSWRPSRDGGERQGPQTLQERGRAIYEIGAREPGLEAGRVAVALTGAMIGGASSRELFDVFVDRMGQFLAKTNHQTPAPDALLIAGAGKKRSIPWSVLEHSQYLYLGTGRHSHLLKGSETTHTASTNRAVSRDKRLTHAILADADLPVARQRSAQSERTALRHAREMGFPLVVKPLDGNMGRGVTVDVQDEKRLVEAFRKAQEISRRVILEEMIAGEEYRLLVVNGRFVSAMHRRPGQVLADGVSNLRELVRVENQRPERMTFQVNRLLLLKPIELDDEAFDLLSEQALTLDSVPPRGTTVRLRRASNLSRGGEPLDVTDQVHPSIRRIAERAAAAIGLDICGVDFITTDLGKNHRSVGGAICEVNSRPGIVNHIQFAASENRRIPEAILDMLYPNSAGARLPVVALMGQPDQTRQLRRSLEAVAARANLLLGVVPGKAGRDETLPSTRRLKSAVKAARDNQITAAVIEVTPERLCRDGLGFERVDLAVVADAGGTGAHERAMRALTRVAGPRVVALGDPDALIRSLEALKLPTDAVEAVPAGAFQLPEAGPKRMRSGNGYKALFVGDVGFGESYMHRSRAADLRRLLKIHGHGYSLAWLRGLLGISDLTLANLEVPLATQPDNALRGRKKYLGWCDPEPTLAALREAGIDAVSLANNHALDCGTAGLAETMTRLREAEIASFGAGRNAAAAARPLVRRFTVAGRERSLVVFGGFEYRARYDSRYHWYAGRSIAGIAELSADRIGRQIVALRQTLPRPVFVAFPHWGANYEDVTPGQRDMAAQLAEAGIDLIIGHGAHIVQGTEIVGGCPVVYNIGNFVWNAPGRFAKRGVPPFGAAAALHIGAETASLRLYPIMTDNSVTGFQSRPVAPEEFTEAAALISNDLPRGRDEWGHYLSLKLPEKARTSDIVSAVSMLRNDDSECAADLHPDRDRPVLNLAAYRVG